MTETHETHEKGAQMSENMYDYKWIEPYKPSRWKPMYWDRVTQPGWIAEQKENGWRLQIIAQPSGELHVYSSSGRRMPAMEAELRKSRIYLPGEVSKYPEDGIPLASLIPEGTILDTEAVVAHDEYCTCDRTGRPVGFDATSHFLANHPEGIEFRVFDILRMKGLLLLNTPLWSRRLTLAHLLDNIYCSWDNAAYSEGRISTHELETVDREEEDREGGASRILKMVKYIRGSDLELHTWIDELQASGAEGVVFKNLYSKYQPGRRTVDWLKKKWAMITYDVVITEALGPSEKMDPDWVRLAYGWSDGTRIGPSVGVAPYQCHQDVAASYMGRVLELQGDELMPSGVILYPRFSRFRDDKRAIDCILGEQDND